MHYMNTEMIQSFGKMLISEEKSMATISKYLHDINVFYRYMGQEKMVTKEIVIAYKEKLRKSYAISSVNSMLAALNCFFNRNGWYDCVVKAFKVQREIFRSRDRELTREEYYHLLKTAKKKGNERIYLVMQTICSTGIRVSELQFITIESLCTRRATVTLKGKTRTVLLPTELCQILQRYVKKKGIKQGCVFITRSGKPLDRSNILHDMKNLCEEAGVNRKKVFPHNLRHLFAVSYYQLEKDLTRLADLLGHANINTTRIYTLVNGEEQAKQIELLRLID